MRTREEIMKDRSGSPPESNNEAVLETLLDIRSLLSKLLKLAGEREDLIEQILKGLK